MERAYEEPAVRFATEILQQHPQISYENAVSAAEYAGLSRLPRDVFFDTAARLGLPRDRTEVAAGSTSPAEREAAGLRSRLTAQTEGLLARLSAFEADLAETARIRSALEGMRRVVLAALAEID